MQSKHTSSTSPAAPGPAGDAAEAELERSFWKALDSDKTLMLGLAHVEEGHAQPMTAQFDGEPGRGPLWFFTSRDTDLVEAMTRAHELDGGQHRAIAHFVAKGHELFASLHGNLVLDNDSATVDRLWNRFVAAWYEGGKEDPKLQLLRFEPDRAQIWRNEHSLVAGVKLLLGIDPKADYRDKVADVRLS